MKPTCFFVIVYTAVDLRKCLLQNLIQCGFREKVLFKTHKEHNEELHKETTCGKYQYNDMKH